MTLPQVSGKGRYAWSPSLQLSLAVGRWEGEQKSLTGSCKNMRRLFDLGGERHLILLEQNKFKRETGLGTVRNRVGEQGQGGRGRLGKEE